MIAKFDSLFAGHIDMDDVGYSGAAVNDRRFTNEALATVFDKAQAMAQLMDRVGYDTFWMAEHHFQREGYECIPNVLMAAVHLAHLTRRLRFGCGFNITPMWHPLRLAEDFATADILTRGRVTFGVGRGYHRARWRRSGHLSSISRRTASCSRSRWRSSSRRCTRSPSRTTASTTPCRPPFPIAATAPGADARAAPAAAARRVLAADSGRDGAGHRLHGGARHQGGRGRRLGRRGRHAPGGHGVARGARAPGPRSRARRGPLLRVSLLHRR